MTVDVLLDRMEEVTPVSRAVRNDWTILSMIRHEVGKDEL